MTFSLILFFLIIVKFCLFCQAYKKMSKNFNQMQAIQEQVILHVLLRNKICHYCIFSAFFLIFRDKLLYLNPFTIVKETSES